MVNFWIGYNHKYPEAFEATAKSLTQFDIKCFQLPSLFEEEGTTPFTRTRFLPPQLDMSTNEWVAFVDDDFIFLDDPQQIVSNFDNTKSIYVCKHPNYTSSVQVKSSGKQTNYDRKNWSSLIFWNKGLFDSDVDVFNSPLSYLHSFQWVDDEHIGSIDLRWNWLVGEYEEDRTDIKALHYTLGGPWYPNAYTSNYNKKWLDAN